MERKIKKKRWLNYKLHIKKPGFDALQQQEIFLFSTTSRPFVRPTQTHMQRVTELRE